MVFLLFIWHCLNGSFLYFHAAFQKKRWYSVYNTIHNFSSSIFELHFLLVGCYESNNFFSSLTIPNVWFDMKTDSNQTAEETERKTKRGKKNKLVFPICLHTMWHVYHKWTYAGLCLSYSVFCMVSNHTNNDLWNSQLLFIVLYNLLFLFPSRTTVTFLKKLICIFSRPLLILPFTAPWVGFGCSILHIVYSIKKLYCIHNVYSFSNCQLRVSWNFGGYLVLFCAGVCSWNLWTISLQHRGHNHIAYVIILPDSPTS